MNKNNPYGYKVGYRVHGSRIFIKKFIAHTLPAARKMLYFYRKYGHNNAQKQRIHQVNYDIKPITKREILAGIWDEIPFKKRHQTATFHRYS